MSKAELDDFSTTVEKESNEYAFFDGDWSLWVVVLSI